MVYVISHTGKALMPTQRHGKVRLLLRDGKARVVKTEPFTIQLLYDNTEHTQSVTLGVDAGTGHVGFSATTESGVSYRKLKFLSISKSLIIDKIKRLAAIPPTNEFVGFLAEVS